MNSIKFNFQKYLFLLTLYDFCLQEKNVDHVFWTNEMNSLISRCTLYPHRIGLTVKNFQIIEKLPKQIEILLSLMMKYLPEIYLEEFKRNILLEAKKNALDYLEIQDIIDRKKDIETLQDFTKGLLILRKCRFVNFETEVFVIYYIIFNNQ